MGSQARYKAGRGDRDLNNIEMAASLIEQAKRRFETAKREYETGSRAYSIRSSQECVELASKGALRLIGIEYPKKHDVSDVLLKFAERFPKWFNVEKIARNSSVLAAKREAAMYGNEEAMMPADSLFTGEEAADALKMAEETLKEVNKLFEEFTRK